MLDLYRYQLPFKRPFVTGAGTFQHREGLILRYHAADIDVVSEVAPLPGFSEESLQEAESHIKSIKKQAESFFDRHYTPDELNSWINSQSLYKSVDFGLSSLGLIILSSRLQKPLYSLLGMSSAASLSVNAVIGESDEASFLSQAKRLIINGFKVLKCKVTASPGHLPGTLKILADEHPNVLFRLDANRSWPANDVYKLSSRFCNLPIEYIEEPCPVETVNQFDAISGECSVPLAADETLAELGFKTFIDHMNTAPYLIIKPTLHGNLMELFATLRSRHHLVDRVIFTTALESAVGTRMIALAASMAGSHATAHGLNTGSLFRQDLTDERAVIDGTFQLQPNSMSWYTFQSVNQSLLKPVQ